MFNYLQLGIYLPINTSIAITLWNPGMPPTDQETAATTATTGGVSTIGYKWFTAEGT